MSHRPCFVLLLLAMVAYSLEKRAQVSVTDYAPTLNTECPDITNTEFVRIFTPQNQTLHPQETEYINQRLSSVIDDAWDAWLGDGSQMGYNVSAFQGNYSKVGMAIPGGGLRAALYGAGTMSGLDARNESAKAAGTGGLLQVTSYITGLSGGSWVTGSLVFNNWPTIKDLVYGNGDLAGWLLDLPFATPDGDNIFSEENQYFFGSILWSIMAKANAGIDTSITDPWARMISYHFLNQTNRGNFFTNDSAHGAGQLWSDIPQIPAFQQFQMPFPIIVADSRPVGSNLTTRLTLDPVVYEITPFEFGSYDPNLSAAVNLTFAGTHLTNGKPDNGSACVTGFDQAGFVMGSSASLFNQIFDFAHNAIDGWSASDGKGLLYVLSRQLSEVRTRADDVANWPNPFNGLKNTTFVDSDKTWLELIDGASNNENVPYGPLFVNARGLEVIVTLENSADIPSNNWPNGTALLFTAERQRTLLRSSHQQFPPIPQTADDFISTGVNARPTFFGCDPVQTPPEYPMVIYLPNAPPIDGSDPVNNSPTFKLAYTPLHTRLLLDQVHSLTISGFTPNANTPDPNWGTCLQCAMVDRTRRRASPAVARSDMCTKCFQQYCYDPQNPPSKDELPNRKLNFVDPDPQGLTKVEGFLGDNKFKLIGGLIGLVVFIGLLTAGLLWWKKRKDQRRYKLVNNLHEDETKPIRPYSDFVRTDSDFVRAESYELPAYRGGQAPPVSYDRLP